MTNYKGLHLRWVEEWSQFFVACNWYTFHPLHLEFEFDRCMGGLEFTLIIIGLGFQFRWNYAVTDKVLELEAAMREVENQTQSGGEGNSSG